MAADNAEAIDTQFEIVTPENIAFQYRLAGPFQRLPAFLIDLLIQYAVLIILFLGVLFFFGMIRLGFVGVGLGLVIQFVISWFYAGLFEALWNGQTPGKRLMRLRVISADGQPIRPVQAILRNVLHVADCQPFYLYQVGLWVAACNRRYARLGDLVCGTMVVIEEPQYRSMALRVTEPEALRLAELIPAGFRVPRDMALALSSYVLRRRALPWTRRVQIARHLGEPLRMRFGLPPQTSYDMLLCAMYHRTFFAGAMGQAEAAPRPVGSGEIAVALGATPFADAPPGGSAPVQPLPTVDTTVVG
ncbi:MAG: RDD family protein [Pirellulales bacterium]|nr:RDD family protein [Pirellulales bacterium]